MKMPTVVGRVIAQSKPFGAVYYRIMPTVVGRKSKVAVSLCDVCNMKMSTIVGIAVVFNDWSFM